MGTLGLNFRRCQPGHVACPKCFGETELVLTKRDEQGWPEGPLVRKTCDHCEGTGEVTPDRVEKPQHFASWPLPKSVMSVEVVKANADASKWGQHTKSN